MKKKYVSLGRILQSWDYKDDVDSAAALVFQQVVVELFYTIFSDELGNRLTETIYAQPYFWQQRLLAIVIDEQSAWFDDTDTDNVIEMRADSVREAAIVAYDKLAAKYGADPLQWRWGVAHKLEFPSVLRKSGFGRSLASGGSYPMGGRERRCIAVALLTAMESFPLHLQRFCEWWSISPTMIK